MNWYEIVMISSLVGVGVGIPVILLFHYIGRRTGDHHLRQACKQMADDLEKGNYTTVSLEEEN